MRCQSRPGYRGLEVCLRSQSRVCLSQNAMGLKSHAYTLLTLRRAYTYPLVNHLWPEAQTITHALRVWKGKPTRITIWFQFQVPLLHRSTGDLISLPSSSNLTSFKQISTCLSSASCWIPSRVQVTILLSSLISFTSDGPGPTQPACLESNLSLTFF